MLPHTKHFFFLEDIDDPKDDLLIAFKPETVKELFLTESTLLFCKEIKDKSSAGTGVELDSSAATLGDLYRLLGDDLGRSDLSFEPQLS